MIDERGDSRSGPAHAGPRSDRRVAQGALFDFADEGVLMERRYNDTGEAARSPPAPGLRPAIGRLVNLAAEAFHELASDQPAFKKSDTIDSGGTITYQSERIPVLTPFVTTWKRIGLPKGSRGAGGVGSSS